MPTRPERLYELDGLRLLAALFVVLFHYVFSGWAGDKTTVTFVTESAWAKYGYLGVDLFFLISGFVVLMSAWGRSPRQFVVSRVVRLYPAYWVGIAITALVTVTLGQGLFQVSLTQVLANLTMFQAIPNIENVDVVYWTLWAEMRFYLLILVFTFIGMTRGRIMAALWGWLALTFLAQAGVLPGIADLVVQSEFSHYFIAGMALFMLYRFGLDWQIALLVPICLGNAVYRAIGYAEAVGERYSVTYSPVIITALVVLIFLIMTFVALRVTQPLSKAGDGDGGRTHVPALPAARARRLHPARAAGGLGQQVRAAGRADLGHAGGGVPGAPVRGAAARAPAQAAAVQTATRARRRRSRGRPDSVT